MIERKIKANLAGPSSDALAKLNKERNVEHKRIILIGAGASGKDYARKLFQDRNFSFGITCTTRPKRNGELNGEDYFFISDNEFKRMIKDEEFYEWTTFKGGEWYYGTLVSEFYTKDIFMMTPSGVDKIRDIDRERSFIIYFDIAESVRKNRLYQRLGMADSVERRLKTDREDFIDFVNYDIKIMNENF
jgi:guanylate kinase